MTVLQGKRKWIGHGVWAVADQGMYAISTALLNILLARWLLPVEYGAFAVAYSAFLLIGAFHVALLIEPMLVFGPGQYAGRFAGYLRLLVRGNHLLTLAGSLLLIATGLSLSFFGSRMLGNALLGLAVAAPFTLFMWLAKRAAYIQQRSRLAAIQSGIYFVLLLTGLFVLKSFQRVSVLSAMLVMGCAGALAGLWLMKRLRTLNPHGADVPDRRSVLTAHWGYGRWALLTGVLVWVPLNFYFVVLSTWISLEASATLKALTNLVLPLLQVNAALSAVLLPLLVTRVGDSSEFRRLVDHSLILFVAFAVPYALVIGVFGRSLVNLLYGGRYHATTRMMWLLALIPILDGVQAVLACALRSLQQPKQIFRAQLLAAACVLAVGTAATGALGVIGAVGGMVLASLLAAAMLASSLSRHQAEPGLLLRPVN